MHSVEAEMEYLEKYIHISGSHHSVGSKAVGAGVT